MELKNEKVIQEGDDYFATIPLTISLKKSILCSKFQFPMLNKIGLIIGLSLLVSLSFSYDGSPRNTKCNYSPEFSLIEIKNSFAYNINCMPPPSIDLEIDTILYPNDTICSLSFTPKILVCNNSVSDSVSSFNILYKNGTGSFDTTTWTGNMRAGECDTVDLPVYTLMPGSHKFIIEIQTTNINGSETDINSFNNIDSTEFFIDVDSSVVDTTICQGDTLTLLNGRKVFNTGVYYDTVQGSSGSFTVTNVLFSEDFEGATHGFTLNTTDVSSITPGVNDNAWIVNNNYTGGTLFLGFVTVPNTPSQNAAVTGNINSKYLHIHSRYAVANGTPSFSNCNYFDAAGSTAVGASNGMNFSKMTNDISTVGKTNVSFNMYYLCKGSWGRVYYSTNGGTSWTRIGGNLIDSNWTNFTIANPAFDNQATLRFGVAFDNTNGVSADPAYGVDEISIESIDLVTSSGCDSIIRYNVTVTPPKDTTIYDTICATQTYTLPGGGTTTTTGIYRDTLNGALCDSIVITDLHVKDTSSSFHTVMACDSFVSPSGKIWKTSNTYLDTINNANGCDSLMTFNLTIGGIFRDSVTDTVCDSTVWRGMSINTTGVYRDTVNTGCDSIFLLNLQVDTTKRTTVDTTICQGDTITLLNGTKIFNTGVYYDTVQGSSGSFTVTNVLFSEDFEGATHGFTLNTTDAGSITPGVNDNAWIVNNSYIGGTFTFIILPVVIPNTPNQSAAITGNINSKYLHIHSRYAENNSTPSIVNCNYLDGSITSVGGQNGMNFSRMTNDISTVGKTNVSFNMYYLCKGSWGRVYYSTNGGTSWTRIGGNLIDSNWTNFTIANPAFDNQATLRFGVAFDNTNGVSADPAYGVDEISIESIDLVTSSGCDSIIRYNVTVTPPKDTTIYDTICATQTYTLPGGGTTTTTGIYRDTLNGALCDSIVITDLHVKDTSSSFHTVMACDSFVSPSGKIWKTSNTYLDTINNANGCDSLMTFNLTIGGIFRDSVTDTVCDSTVWRGMSINTTGVYRDTVNTGCDSIFLLNLQVDTTKRTTVDTTICQGDTITLLNGTKIFNTGVYYDTVQGSSGSFTVTNVLFSEDFEGATHGFTLNTTDVSSITPGVNDNAWIVNNSYIGGTFTFIILPVVIPNTPNQNAAITGNINSKYLHIHSRYAENNSTPSIVNCNYLDGSITSVGGQNGMNFSRMTNDISTVGKTNVSFNMYYLCKGSLGRLYYSTNGGTSWTRIGGNLIKSSWTNFTIANPAFDNQTTLRFGVAFNNTDPNPEDPAYGVDEISIESIDLVTSSGCDSIITYNVTVTPPKDTTIYDTICATQTYTLPGGGTTTMPGTYRDTIMGSRCDSVVITHLQVGDTSSSSHTVTSCNNFVSPSGKTWTSTGMFVDTIPNSSGCDSLMTFNLTILPASTRTVNANGCDSYILPGGLTVTSTGIYRDTFSSSNGCDSIIITNLVLGNTTTNPQSLTICSGQTVTVGGNVYSMTGIYRDTLLSQFGCDSIVVTNLSVDPLTASNITFTTDLCANESPVTFTATPAGGGWSGPGIDPGTGLFDPMAAGVGVHTILYTAPGGCGTADTALVTVYSVPNINSSGIDDECDQAQGAIDVTINGGSLPINYSWSNGATTEDLTGIKKGTYTLTVVDINGCRDAETTTIVNITTSDCEYNIFVPNIFSPDGNGENDVLQVEGSGIETLEFIIYNRWGNLIFESSSQADGWDGTYKGSVVNQGVFVYYVKGTFVDGVSFNQKGTVTLVR